MLWARVDYKALLSKNSSFITCSEKKPSARCFASAMRLVHCTFANSLIDERVKEQKCYTSSTFYYSFISFYRRAKTNFIGTISHLHIRLFFATCWLNIEMISDGMLWAGVFVVVCTFTYIHSYTCHTYMLVNHQLLLNAAKTKDYTWLNNIKLR